MAWERLGEGHYVSPRVPLQSLCAVRCPSHARCPSALRRRSEWSSAFVIASIVSLEDDDQRVRIINRWIEVAIETRAALGNLYGFANIVQGLCSSQVRNKPHGALLETCNI